MKTFVKALLLAGVMPVLVLSCKKTDTGTVPENGTLEQSTDFRNYVAADLLAKARYSVHLFNQLSATQYADFRNRLRQSDEAGMQRIFQDYRLDYTGFRQLVVGSVVRSAKAIREHPLNGVPDQAAALRYGQAYKNIADDILEKARQKALGASRPSAKGMFQTDERVQQSDLQHTNMLPYESSYAATPEEFGSELTEGMIIDLIAAELNVVHGDGITASEAWGCFKSAMGVDGLTMGGIVGWARASAGMQIQAFISFATGWALKHIGWIGAAMAVVDFGVCLYDAY